MIVHLANQEMFRAAPFKERRRPAHSYMVNDSAPFAFLCAFAPQNSSLSKSRCNCSDGHLAWLDRTLQVRETANTTLDRANYEIKGWPFATELKRLTHRRDRLMNKSSFKCRGGINASRTTAGTLTCNAA